jgi:hypothetical protein
LLGASSALIHLEVVARTVEHRIADLSDDVKPFLLGFILLVEEAIISNKKCVFL